MSLLFSLSIFTYYITGMHSIELTSDTSFSISAQLGLTEGILENLASLGVEGEFSSLRQEKKIFEVKFIDV